MIGTPKPLVIITADKDAQFAIQELVRRPADLGIRSIDFDCFVHPRHDSGVFNQAHEFLRPFLKWDHALVLFDREGCGHEETATAVLEDKVEDRLSANGWESRCRAVVLDPELEAWVWDASLQASRLLDWPEGAVGLKRWMADRDFRKSGQVKPARPKEAFDAALRYRQARHSSGRFRDLAKTFKFANCRDPAFQRFIATLQSWFPV